MRPMTAEEAWEYIFDRYKAFHNNLKKFGYDYNMWIPNNESIRSMFAKENLTDKEIDVYKNLFINKIYNEQDLRRFDDVFNKEVKLKLERAINKFLVPLLPLWNAKLPEKLTILCAYGCGGGYDRDGDKLATIMFRMSEYLGNKYGMFNTFFHEFVHLLIETPIIQKYHVPQDLKERIVDIICYEFIQKPVQKSFENSFANAYITPEAIKTNLPAAVQKMMSDYNAKNKNLTLDTGMLK